MFAIRFQSGFKAFGKKIEITPFGLKNTKWSKKMN